MRSHCPGTSRATFLLEASGEKNPFPCLFRLLEATCVPWLVASEPAASHHLSLTLLPCMASSLSSGSTIPVFPFIKTLVVTTSPPRESWKNLSDP